MGPFGSVSRVFRGFGSVSGVGWGRGGVGVGSGRGASVRQKNITTLGSLPGHSGNLRPQRPRGQTRPRHYVGRSWGQFLSERLLESVG